MPLLNLPDPVKNRLLETFRSIDQIKEVYLFGSRARGDHRPNSDIDLAIVADGVRSSHLAQIQEAGALYQVDIVVLSDRSITPEFIEEINADKIQIYSR
ncbi:nucleotidyltransferase domain-containing protein [Cohnella sp.]|uniref:nucleotidyltransferase domain-containing protein n=1 Tax=Cohnella sp. TaxID=1883426 RepID=UPI00356AF6B6